MSTEKKGIDPNTIIVAVLGLLGTIVAALIGVYGSRGGNVPTLTPAPPTAIVSFTDTAVPTAMPTETLPPEVPTFTLVPATDTPVPTFTPIPPVAIGQDWAAGCISTLWRVYPAGIPAVDRGDGCWKEPVHVFSAENGDLDFLSERGNGGTEVYGMFAPLPESGSVTLQVRLRDLTNTDMWVGIFQEPEISSQGLLLTIAAGDPKKRVIAWKDIATYETIQKTSPLDQGNGFSFTFTFDTLSVTGKVNPSGSFATNPVPVPSDQKWLFVGYKGLTGYYRVDGSFFNFKWE